MVYFIWWREAETHLTFPVLLLYGWLLNSVVKYLLPFLGYVIRDLCFKCRGVEGSGPQGTVMGCS